MEYRELAGVYEQLEATSKRLEKTWIVSRLLKRTEPENLSEMTLLLQGRVFPAWHEGKIGVAAKTVLKAVNLATGTGIDSINSEWSRIGDLGKVAEKLVGNKKQATLFSGKLDVSKVYNNLRKLPELEGEGSIDQKIQLIAELLTSAEPIEARYIVRTVLEDLRVGVADGTLRDAITWACFEDEIGLNYDEKEKKISPDDRERYNEYIDAVQAAYDVCNDFGVVADRAMKEGLTGLKQVGLEVGKPVKVMLFQKAKDIDDAFERVGKPAAFEYKYDGFRLQCHKKDNRIMLFTRRLEDVTRQFPDVADYVVKNVEGDSFVLDAEAVGYDPKTGKYLPFQSISQRIKRKYDIEGMAKRFPVELNVFDILDLDNRSLMKEPYRKRRDILKGMVTEEPKKIVLAKQIITSDPYEAGKFYQESLDRGEEGVMAKNLEGIYKPGSRVGYGVKIKPVMETLDVVIIGAEWGTGKRSGWLSSFSIACRDGDTGELLEIGKVGTGIKELEGTGVTFEYLTNLLRPLITEEKAREVRIKPSVVIEVNYEEIQKSPTYSSGFALRFPRVIRIREDRMPEDASTLSTVEDLYYEQKK